MLVVKLGGPAYRIGLGGGAASSRGGMVRGLYPKDASERGGDVGGDAGTYASAGGDESESKSDVSDVDAVQRGDPQMGNKIARVVRACVEGSYVDGDGGDGSGHNPILSIHDQGAGGNANVLKELVSSGDSVGDAEATGACIDLAKFPLGDTSLGALEIWGSEYQENHALLCEPGEAWERLQRIAGRERVPVAAVGLVTNDGRIRLVSSAGGSGDGEEGRDEGGAVDQGASPIVDLPLSKVLQVERRRYTLERQGNRPEPRSYVNHASGGGEEDGDGDGAVPSSAQQLGKKPVAPAATPVGDGSFSDASGDPNWGRLELPPMSARTALRQMCRLVAVGSKRFLTSKG